MEFLRSVSIFFIMSVCFVSVIIGSVHLNESVNSIDLDENRGLFSIFQSLGLDFIGNDTCCKNVTERTVANTITNGSKSLNHENDKSLFGQLDNDTKNKNEIVMEEDIFMLILKSGRTTAFLKLNATNISEVFEDMNQNNFSLAFDDNNSTNYTDYEDQDFSWSKVSSCRLTVKGRSDAN